MGCPRTEAQRRFRVGLSIWPALGCPLLAAGRAVPRFCVLSCVESLPVPGVVERRRRRGGDRWGRTGWPEAGDEKYKFQPQSPSCLVTWTV